MLPFGVTLGFLTLFRRLGQKVSMSRPRGFLIRKAEWGGQEVKSSSLSLGSRATAE